MTSLEPHNEFDSLETFFNTRLKDASAQPAEGTWMQIEEELNRQEKEKSKRRFLWLFSSGLLLLCGLASLWYFMPTDKIQQTKLLASQTKTEIKDPTKETSAITEEPKINGSSEIIKNTSEQKIQLGAFKHKASSGAFNKIPYKVIEVNSADGLTRYYAETNENNALQKIQQAGFTDAFVKNSIEETSSTIVVKQEGEIEKGNASLPSIESTKNSAPSFVSVNSKQKNTLVENTIAKNNDQAKRVSIPEIKNNNDIIEKTETPKIAETTNKTVVMDEAKVKETKIPVTENTNQVGVTKTDSALQNPIVVSVPENKTDSVPAKEEKKEPMTTTSPVKDSSSKSPFIPEWALVFTGGPTIFSANPQSNMFAAGNENHAVTYNGEAKLNYRPFKYFSFSGGVNFTYYTAKQDATIFKFDKHRQEDFIFYSSFGTMAAPMSTLLIGYNVNFPIDTFYAKYSYNSTVQSINIPLEMNFHFLNKSRINLSLGIGINNSFAIAQQTHLSIIKENFNNDINYNNVSVNKFNAMLLMSLGCDVRLTKHWFITLNPSYKYGLTNMSKVNGTTYSPAYISGNLGMKFKF